MSDNKPKLLNLLDLEQIEINLFRGQSHKTGAPQVFGGQVLGQALMAASRTVEDYHVHSLHSYFLRGGDMNAPIIYDVDRIRDGRSFCTRRVVAIQHGRPIFNMSASFQKQEDGYEHQPDMPDVPGPEGLKSDRELKEEIFSAKGKDFNPYIMPDWPIEVRRVEDSLPTRKPKILPPIQHVWFKVHEPLPDNAVIHKCTAAYASDLNLLSTATQPHGVSYMAGNVRMATIDHAMWFHRPVKADDWLLYAMDSPSASGSRGFTRGLIFNQQGQLVASCTQEGLMRKLD